MKTFDKWLPFIRIAGTSREESIDAIRAAVRDFCKETLVYQCTLDAVSVFAEMAEYDYDPPAKTLVVQPLYGWFNGLPLAFKSPNQLNMLYPGTDWTALAGTPRYITQHNPRTFRLVPYPEESASLAAKLHVALKPTDDATGIEDFIFEDYRDTIAAGARGRLKMATGKTYFDPDGAKLDMGLFTAKVSEERIRVNNAFGPALNTAYNPFGKFTR